MVPSHPHTNDDAKEPRKGSAERSGTEGSSASPSSAESPSSAAADRPRGSTSSREDLALIASFQSGNAGAFDILVRKYRGPLEFHIKGMIREHQLVEDMVQEVFVKAYENLQGFNPEYAFSTWIYRIATNHAIDHIRKRKLNAVSIHDPIHTKDGEMEREIHDTDASTDSRVLGRERARILGEAILNLPEKYRAVIQMRHMEELSYQEISEELDLPIGTVKAHIFRAREMLYKALKDREGTF